jgi:hypothetical protein
MLRLGSAARATVALTRRDAVCSLAALLLAGCTGPAVRFVNGSSFRSEPINAERVYVIVNFPQGHVNRLAEPLGAKLQAALAREKLQAAVENQVLNPLALDSGINFHGALAYRANAILLARAGESVTGSSGAYWTVNFDLLDSRGNGAWRGSFTLRRLQPVEETAEQLANQLVKALIDARAVNPRERNAT